MMPRKMLFSLAAVAALTTGAVSSQAGTTPIQDPGFDNTGLVQALRQAYGYGAGVTSGDYVTNQAGFYGAAADAMTVTFTLGLQSITFTRMPDDNVFGVDQYWTGDGTFVVESKVSGDNPQVFGITDVLKSTHTNLVSVTGSGVFTSNPSDTGSYTAPSNPFLFYFEDQAGVHAGTKYYSNDGIGQPNDRIATFFVSGVDIAKNSNIFGAYVLAFNDPGSTDWDYQDMVVQVTPPGGGAIPTPLPAAVWGGLSMISALGMGAFSRRRK